MVICFAEPAMRNLEELQPYIEREAPAVGARHAAEMPELVQPLVEHPDMGRIVPERVHSFLRELIHPPLRIVYHSDPRRVRLVRIWRSQRSIRVPTGEGS
jgi:plasmid stabilization system protein ParE